MKRPVVKCPQCSGVGTSPISDPLWEVFFFVRRHPGTTAPEVHTGIMRDHGYVPHVTAINNRLETLLNMGLVKRERWGKAWKYTVK